MNLTRADLTKAIREIIALHGEGGSAVLAFGLDNHGAALIQRTEDEPVALDPDDEASLDAALIGPWARRAGTIALIERAVADACPLPYVADLGPAYGWASLDSGRVEARLNVAGMYLTVTVSFPRTYGAPYYIPGGGMGTPLPLGAPVGLTLEAIGGDDHRWHHGAWSANADCSAADLLAALRDATSAVEVGR